MSTEKLVYHIEFSTGGKPVLVDNDDSAYAISELGGGRLSVDLQTFEGAASIVEFDSFAHLFNWFCNRNGRA